MFRSKESQRARERATEYATCKDFQQIFKEDMAGLHLLAYLLTADQAKAEQCFVAGLEDSIHGNPVFKQWARTWSKRAIILNAIKAMAPATVRAEAASLPVQPNGEQSPLISMVLQWPVFERFVFVMSVLEGYAVRECAALLACTDQQIVATKSRVLERLADGSWQAATVLSSPRWNALFAGAQVA
jgi:DNA-directed RNA polymerase specialized sigma24 family protein